MPGRGAPLPLSPMFDFSSAHKPLFIAGPCSAETREQVLDTALALRQLPVHLFRAGVWKPRTKPGSFEGSGEPALAWLQEVQQSIGLPVTVEVAEPAHIELALKYNIDVLWIGARTTVNPFQVQRLADALRGVDIPVMVKNPVNPDVDLWEGAIQRFERVGIRQVAAIHRGFSSYGASAPYRNAPNWTIPIELKRRRPELMVITDPSHITGNRELVAEVAQRAMDMSFDGLMIEVHPDPVHAWSDAAQQITPASLEALMQRLVIRHQECPDQDVLMDLESLRATMDSVDAEIVDLLRRRMELSERIGVVKLASNMAAYQPERWREIVAARTEQGNRLQLSPEYITALFEIIHHESIRRQLEVMQAGNNSPND